jgi:hypothetical protein
VDNFYFGGMKNVSLLCVTKLKNMTNQNIIWAVSQISVWINEEVGTTQGSLIVWYCKNGTELTLDTETDSLDICDSKLDNKTYFALAGLCKSLEVELYDTFTEKTVKTKK